MAKMSEKEYDALKRLVQAVVVDVATTIIYAHNDMSIVNARHEAEELFTTGAIQEELERARKEGSL